MRFNHRVLARHLYHASCVEGHLRVTPTSPLRVYPALSATLTAGFANIPVLSGSRLSSNAAPIGRGPKLIASSEHSDTTEDDLKDARRVARDVLGIDRLRPEQEAVISRILGGQNSMIVGPAGSGRSLGYVIPALVARSRSAHPGLTLVISPSLTACMARVKTLKAMGIHASYLTLTTSRTDKKRILASLRDGMTSILYIPIVYTAHHSIQSALGNVPGGIRVLVVDQADRTSQSTTSYGDGHHHVAHFVEKVTPHIVHFQTDKSTKKIAKDICAKFMIDETNVIQSLDSLPANIELRVVSVRTSHNKYAALCGLLDSRPGKTLIYTFAEREEMLASKLRGDCHDVTALRPLRADNVRGQQQTFEVAAQTEMPKQRIICTSMHGVKRIGKSEIRHIIFHALPKSIDHLVRMTRDAGLNADSGRVTIILCGEEVFLNDNREAVRFPSILSVKALLQEIFDSKRRSLDGPPAYVVNASKLSSQLQMHRQTIYDMIKSLILLEFASNSMQLMSQLDYSILREDTPLDNDASPRRRAVVQYLLKHRKTGKIDVFDMAETLGKDHVALIKDVLRLNQLGFVKIKPTEWVTLVAGKTRPSDEEMESIARTYHAQFLELQKRMTADRHALIHSLTSARCIMASVADHLDQQLSGGTATCGRCTFCATGESVDVKTVDVARIDLGKVERIVRAFPEFLHDPRILVRIALGFDALGLERDVAIRQKMGRENPLVGSMKNCGSEELLRWFAMACGIPKEQLKDC